MHGKRARDRTARLKPAELLFSIGAMVLGAALSSYVGNAVVPLLVAGIASHG